MEDEVRVYQVGDYHFIAAVSAKSARRFFLETFEPEDDEHAVRLVPERELHDSELTDYDHAGTTFKEHLDTLIAEGHELPFLLAGEE